MESRTAVIWGTSTLAPERGPSPEGFHQRPLPIGSQRFVSCRPVPIPVTGRSVGSREPQAAYRGRAEFQIVGQQPRPRVVSKAMAGCARSAYPSEIPEYTSAGWLPWCLSCSSWWWF